MERKKRKRKEKKTGRWDDPENKPGRIKSQYRLYAYSVPGGRGTHMKGQYGYVRWSRPRFSGSLTVHQTPSCILLRLILKTPVFKNSWFLAPKMEIFSNFAAPKAHFLPEFQLFTSKISWKLHGSLAHIFASNPFFTNTHPFQSRVPSPHRYSITPKKASLWSSHVQSVLRLLKNAPNRGKIELLNAFFFQNFSIEPQTPLKITFSI